MQVKLAVLADYANVTTEGKLNILGIFDRIQVARLPAVHPQMQFILRLEAHPAERDRAHGLEIRLHDPDGKTAFELKGEVVPRGGGPVETISSNQIVTINNLNLEQTGEFLFVVFVDNDLKAELPLVVEQARNGASRAPDGADEARPE
jgi:hypothetical protein